MAVFEKIAGTTLTAFVIGIGGPQVKASGSALEARNNADDAYVVMRSAPPVGNNDAVIKSHFDTTLAAQLAGYVKLDGDLARNTIEGSLRIDGGSLQGTNGATLNLAGFQTILLSSAGTAPTTLAEIRFDTRSGLAVVGDGSVTKTLGDAADDRKTARVVTTTNITLAGGAPDAYDGIGLAVDDRILVTGQTAKAENGLFRVSVLGTGTNGTWVRVYDHDASRDFRAGQETYIVEGTAGAATVYRQTTIGAITVDTTDVEYAEAGGGGGLTVLAELSGTYSAIAYAGIEPVAAASDLVLKPTGTRSIIAAIPDGTPAGGNVRGIYSVDLGIAPRSSANQVASGTYSTLVGGIRARASGNYSTAIGGWAPSATNLYATAIGGENALATSAYATVVGGQNGLASGTYSGVLAGTGITASGSRSVALGGSGTNVTGDYSANAGGSGNSTGGDYAVSLGGVNNSNAAAYGMVFGGNRADTSNTYTTVINGLRCQASALAATAVGGYSTLADHPGTIAFSGNNTGADDQRGRSQGQLAAFDKQTSAAGLSYMTSILVEFTVPVGSGFGAVTKQGSVTAIDETTNESAHWTYKVAASNAGGAAAVHSQTWVLEYDGFTTTPTQPIFSASGALLRLGVNQASGTNTVRWAAAELFSRATE